MTMALDFGAKFLMSNQALLLTRCVTLDKLLELSVFSFVNRIL